MNEPSSSVMFRCDKCSAVIKGESAFWNHLSTLHFEYYPYRCGYCADFGDIHSTTTEDKMKHHLETIHHVKDLKISIHRKHDIETQLQAIVDKCRLKSENSPDVFQSALRQVYNALDDGLQSSIRSGYHREATLPLPEQREDSAEASETTIDDTADTDEQDQSANETRMELASSMESSKQQAVLVTPHIGQIELISATVEDENSNAEKRTSVNQIESQPLPSKRRKCPSTDDKARKMRKIGNNISHNNVFGYDSPHTTDSATMASAEPENAQEQSLEMISEQQDEIMVIAVNSNETAGLEEISDVNEAAVKINMGDHISTKSKDDTSSQAGEKSLKCTICFFTASHERVLKRHLSHAHIKNPLLKCQYCSYVTVLTSTLSMHLLKHKRDKSKTKNSPIQKKK
ncbi:hypothetical protein Ddc_18040 [Ditylenchus destructor]|nr:hypothetical protein Ddc_18040 [Ditylenchus destructor]